MTSERLNSIVRASMGSVPGPLVVNAEATAVEDMNGCLVLSVSAEAPEWQRRATLDAVCLLFNNKAEIIAALELHNAYHSRRSEPAQLAVAA